MAELIVGSEALAAGMVTRQMLRSRYVKVHYNVYAPVGSQLESVDRATAAWLGPAGRQWSPETLPRLCSALVGYRLVCRLNSLAFVSLRRRESWCIVVHSLPTR